MNSSNSIGGFLELENRGGGFPHSDAILLNSGRACFEYILRTNEPARVHLPKFTCDAMLEPLRKLNIPYGLYSINTHFELQEDIPISDDSLIVFTNYFGLKDDYCRKLEGKYRGQLILDYSQAFYAEPSSISHTFYSPRKFFGLPDGGCLYTDQRLHQEIPASTSYGRMSHLLKRVDLGAEAAYPDFKQNEQSLSGEPIQQMSPLTHGLLNSIDYISVKEARLRNYSYLKEHLAASNTLPLSEGGTSCPMVYPFLSSDPGLRMKLIDHRVFVPTYWPNVLTWCDESQLEYNLAKELIPLPIDQRYGQSDMERILGVINGSTN